MAEQALALGLEPLDQEIAQVLRETGLRVINTMELASPEGTVRDAALLHQLGVRYVAGSNLVAFGNRQQALRAAERLNRAGRRLSEEGFKLYYHNHTHEWRTDGGEYLIETLLKNTDPDWVCLQMDAGWAACAGIDPIAFVQQYAGRVELMHVKACTGVLGPEGVGFMAPPPEGDGSGVLPPLDQAEAGPPPAPPEEMRAAMEKIKAVSGPMEACVLDYRALMTAAEANGCQAFTLERDEQYVPDPIQCIREDIAALRTFW